MVKEAELYAPVKAMLEARGYEVKAEVNGCDVVAIKDDAPTVIVELKLQFSLDLVLQGISRQSLTDDVYLAVRAPDTPAKRRNWRGRRRDTLKLCRKLGLGLMQVEQNGRVVVLADTAPYTPRRNYRRHARLMTEFMGREGDPNTGGTNRVKIITAYRQDALRCALALRMQGEMKVADVKAVSGVQKAGAIMQKNHYNWFERTARGIYRLSPAGEDGLRLYSDVVATLGQSS